MTIEDYWQQYLATCSDPLVHPERYPVDQFGDSPELATELGHLIKSGRKTATCSALWEWEAEGETPTSQLGRRSIVVDGVGNPLCIIEITEVKIRPFNQVDAQFAHDEGEGDRSLTFWRNAHWQFFSRVLPNIGKQPAEDMPLVCQRFRVVFNQ